MGQSTIHLVVAICIGLAIAAFEFYTTSRVNVRTTGVMVSSDRFPRIAPALTRSR